jgi:hypothetical protein
MRQHRGLREERIVCQQVSHVPENTALIRRPTERSDRECISGWAVDTPRPARLVHIVPKPYLVRLLQTCHSARRASVGRIAPCARSVRMDYRSHMLL